MKWILPIFAGWLIFLSGCQKEISYIKKEAGNLNPVTSTVQGNIVDENGRPAPGVTIKTGTKSAVTDARGYFRIKNASLDQFSSLITAEKAGYFKAYRVFSASKSVNHIKIKLLKKVLAGTIQSSAGAVVALTNGSKIKFNANSFSKSGAAYSGTVNVYAAVIDPTSTDISETIPGSFIADDKDNQRVVLRSFAMMAVELESTSGEKLNIAAGSSATLSFDVPAGLQSAAPATIPLWFVDEVTGRWREEGFAVKTGNTYTGDVKHFSYWNCDIPGPRVNLVVTIVNQNGQPLVHTEVIVRPVNGYVIAHGFTDSLGRINDPIPANMSLVLEVRAPHPCYNVLYSQNIGPFSSDVNMGVIVVNNSQSLMTIQGRVLNCNNIPVTNGFAEIEYDNMVRYARTNSSGNFSISFATCGAIAPNCIIIGSDSLAQQQGAPAVVPVTLPNTNAGDIIACGNSTLQYLNYSIDGGTTVSLASTIPGDNFTGIDTVGNTTHISYIRGYRSPTENLALDFQSPGIPGVYPIGYLSLAGYGNVTIVTPCSIVLASFPQPGGYYEGSFSGQFRDVSNVMHSVNGALRVKLR